MRGWLFSLVLLPGLLGLSACNRSPDASGTKQVVTLGQHAANEDDDAPLVTAATSATKDALNGTHWPEAKLEGGTARISCEFDYGEHGDGELLTSLDFFGLVDALAACKERGQVRVRYEGKIGAGFGALLQRVAAMSDRMDIHSRVLDISSTGGHVEEAIRAGDIMADTRWDIWVRDRSYCHSACVLVLAGGNTRSIEGKVGIHRLIRDGSKATTRAELRAELKQVHGDVTEYLERNGGAAAVADLMMTVPNRDLRVLTETELVLYGLSGVNAAQADLDRIVVMRKCSKEFVQRRDAFARVFEHQCLAKPGDGFEQQAQCGLELRKRFGFPDSTCPDESPLSEYDREPGRLALEAAGLLGVN